MWIHTPTPDTNQVELVSDKGGLAFIHYVLKSILANGSVKEMLITTKDLHKYLFNQNCSTKHHNIHKETHECKQFLLITIKQICSSSIALHILQKPISFHWYKHK